MIPTGSESEMVQTVESEGAAKRTVTVNGLPVVLEGDCLVAADLKRAAMEQGVLIEESFVLSVEYEPRKTRIIAEEEEIEVVEPMCFVAVANDDNS